MYMSLKIINKDFRGWWARNGIVAAPTVPSRIPVRPHLVSIYTADFRQTLDLAIFKLENIIKHQKDFLPEAVKEAENELPLLKEIKQKYI